MPALWPVLLVESVMIARNPMTRIFAVLTVTLMALAAISPARATMDDDFFGFRRLQRPYPQQPYQQQPYQQQPYQQQPFQQQQQRAYPYYGPGSDYYGGGSGGGAIPRELVSAPVAQPRGSIYISTGERRLYLILGNGEALRYGIGVGRDGFHWTGTHRISAKREWPGWTPPAEMRARRPDLPRYLPGGIENPLGARAMYLGSTLYRIHGSNEPETIGHAVSSGCFRMTNEDAIDLYNRVSVGALVVVR
jgi:lipoprotein-anchoring transpeptidase ErfK/SrfK